MFRAYLPSQMSSSYYFSQIFSNFMKYFLPFRLLFCSIFRLILQFTYFDHHWDGWDHLKLVLEYLVQALVLHLVISNLH